jgi:alpha-beta hydrolase superfamily lysophospholipase
MRHVLHALFFLALIFASSCGENVPANPTVVPVTPTPAPQRVAFTAPDGASMGALLYGSGETAVIFSVMGNCRRGWEDMAELVSQNGVAALTYQWRACKESGTVVQVELQKFIDDLRGAINFMRGQGAQKIILAGASLGGVASAKLAVESSPSGLIIVAAPRVIEDWGFEIGLGDVNIDMPKLFITAEDDSVVPVEKTRELFDLVAEPKEWQTYPGMAHGTELFDTEHGEAIQKRILNFILAIAAEP